MSKVVNISLPEELLKQIDKAAKAEYATRSDFIRESIVRRLKRQRIVDDWGDEGEWEEVADFRSVQPGGVPLADVIKATKKLTK